MRTVGSSTASASQSEASLELGITTFAETYPDPMTGDQVSHGARLRQVVEEIELAEEVGLDVFGVGEHHRPDFASSAPAVVLAAAAGRTSTIRLFPAVSILSTDDPVRVYQQFSTLDAVSGGRAELLVGRGSFIESFPLFGYELEDYNELFSEKLDLLLEIRDNEEVTWSGEFRPDIRGQGIYPRTEHGPLPVRVAVGGTPASIVRAAKRASRSPWRSLEATRNAFALSPISTAGPCESTDTTRPMCRSRCTDMAMCRTIPPKVRTSTTTPMRLPCRQSGGSGAGGR